jgi:hypothetical protein
MFIVSGNLFNVSHYRWICVGLYVVIVKIRKKTLINTERKREP